MTTRGCRALSSFYTRLLALAHLGKVHPAYKEMSGFKNQQLQLFVDKWQNVPALMLKAPYRVNFNRASVNFCKVRSSDEPLMAWSWAFPMPLQHWKHSLFTQGHATRLLKWPSRKVAFQFSSQGDVFHSSFQAFTGVCCWSESAVQRNSVT